MRMGGRASPFGVDADRAGALVRRLIDSGADWRGFHIFAGSQALDAQAIIETQAAALALAARLADEAGAPPPLGNPGGGCGVPPFGGGAARHGAAIRAALGARTGVVEGRGVLGRVTPVGRRSMKTRNKTTTSN